NRTRTRRRTRILEEDNRAPALRRHREFEVRVWHVNECSRAVGCAAAAEFALEDVPDLREVVSVEGKTCSRLVAQKAGVRLGRTIWIGMKKKLRPVLESAHLPFHVINMLELGSMVPSAFYLRHEQVLLGCLEPDNIFFSDPNKANNVERWLEPLRGL